jgi:hypothetical protein
MAENYFHTIGGGSKQNIADRQSFVIDVSTNVEKHKLGNPFFVSVSFFCSSASWNINVPSAAIAWR